MYIHIYIYMFYPLRPMYRPYDYIDYMKPLVGCRVVPGGSRSVFKAWSTPLQELQYGPQRPGPDT